MTDQTKSDSAKLLPCPFCSKSREPSRAIAVVWAAHRHRYNDCGWAVECVCRATGPSGKTQAEAIEAWNRRALPTSATAQEAVAVAVDDSSNLHKKSVDDSVNLHKQRAWDFYGENLRLRKEFEDLREASQARICELEAALRMAHEGLAEFHQTGDVPDALEHIEKVLAAPPPQPVSETAAGTGLYPYQIEMLNVDQARLAVFNAIRSIKFGKPTDDKLIVDALRDENIWLHRFGPEKEHG